VVGLAGLDELTLRLAPALGGLVTVGLLLLMRRDVVSQGTALVAGALAALSPWLIYLSQVARFCTAPGSPRVTGMSAGNWRIPALCHSPGKGAS